MRISELRVTVISVGIVRVRTKATEFVVCFCDFKLPLGYYAESSGNSLL